MNAIGIDGCRSGWVATSSDLSSELMRFDTIAELLQSFRSGTVYFIDIPIGLPSAVRPTRTCESAARSVLAPNRKSSVFNVPCRESLAASDYREANEINKAVLQKGLSKQSFFIFKKIREVDSYLCAEGGAAVLLKESHPEVVFHFLNDNKSMNFNKKTEKGVEERLRVLERLDSRVRDYYEQACTKYRRSDVAKDDIIDSMSLALAGQSVDGYEVATLPPHPKRDEREIEMGIHYLKKLNAQGVHSMSDK